jgi:hypothetical protein
VQQALDKKNGEKRGKKTYQLLEAALFESQKDVQQALEKKLHPRRARILRAPRVSSKLGTTLVVKGALQGTRVYFALLESCFTGTGAPRVELLQYLD